MEKKKKFVSLHNYLNKEKKWSNMHLRQLNKSEPPFSSQASKQDMTRQKELSNI